MTTASIMYGPCGPCAPERMVTGGIFRLIAPGKDDYILPRYKVPWWDDIISVRTCKCKPILEWMYWKQKIISTFYEIPDNKIVIYRSQFS